MTKLFVNQGGTGADTLTGLVKGNGTAPFTTITLGGDTTKFLNGAGVFTTITVPSPTDYVQNQNSVTQTANFRISGDGYIGGKLDIGTPTADTDYALVVRSVDNTDNHGIKILANNQSVALKLGFGAINAVGNFNFTSDTGLVRFITTASQPIYFVTNGMTALTIDSSQNLIAEKLKTGGTAPTTTGTTKMAIVDTLGVVSFATIPNNGDVVGASSSTDNAIVRFDGTGGKTIQNSLITIADDGTMVIPNDVSLTFMGGGGGNNTSLKTGSDGTFLFDTGNTENVKIKGTTGGTTKLSYTDGSFTDQWSADSAGNTSQNGNATILGLTASRVVTTDGSKVLTSSSVTTTELGYVSGVTSAIQTQLNGKLTSTTGVAATSTDNAITRFDGTAGQVQNSLVTIGDTGIISTPLLTGAMVFGSGGSFTTQFSFSTPTANRTFTFPDTSGTVVTVAGSATLTNKTITGLLLTAGTTTVAPLKFAAGTNLTTTQAGAIEFDGTHLYFTATNAGTRYQLDQQVSPTPYVTVSGTSQSAAVNTKYKANNAALVTITLPTTAAVGDQIFIRGYGAGGWKLAQNASQVIHGTSDTTTGTGGYIASQARYDCVTVECIVANNEFIIINRQGTLTVV